MSNGKWKIFSPIFLVADEKHESQPFTALTKVYIDIEDLHWDSDKGL